MAALVTRRTIKEEVILLPDVDSREEAEDKGLHPNEGEVQYSETVDVAEISDIEVG